MVADPADFGGVYGNVSQEQMAINSAALASAIDAVAGGGVVEISGKLYVDSVVNLNNLGQTVIGMRGQSMLGTGIYYGGSSPIDRLVDLQGTSYFRLENLTINGGFKAKCGLFCGRAVTLEPAGKHTFVNVRVVECSEVSYLNYASEDNAHIKCQYQRSPVGAVVTAYPLTSDFYESGKIPADLAASYQSSIAHHFYDCAFGSEAYTTRCGLMVVGSMVRLYGGVVQAATTSEAGVIIESTRRQCSFRDVDVDGNLAPVGYKVGHYSKDEAGELWNNRLIVSGGHITIDGVSGTAFISAYRLAHSIIESASFNGPPDVNIGIDLFGPKCRGNVFVNCIHDDNRNVKINRSETSESDISVLNGSFAFVNDSRSLSMRYSSSVPNRILSDAGLYMLLPYGVYPLICRCAGEPCPRLTINNVGTLLWGNGQCVNDVKLERGGPDLLKTQSKFESKK